MFKNFKKEINSKNIFEAKEIIRKNRICNAAICKESDDNGTRYGLMLKEKHFGESSLRECEKAYINGTISFSTLVEMQKSESAPICASNGNTGREKSSISKEEAKTLVNNKANSTAETIAKHIKNGKLTAEEKAAAYEELENYFVIDRDIIDRSKNIVVSEASQSSNRTSDETKESDHAPEAKEDPATNDSESNVETFEEVKEEPSVQNSSEEEKHEETIPFEEVPFDEKQENESIPEVKEDSTEAEKKNVIEAEVNNDNVNVASSTFSTIKDEDRNPITGSEEVDLAAIMRNNPILGVDATPNIENISDESESAPDIKTPIMNIDSFKYASDYIDAYACAITNCIRAFAANSEAGMSILNEVIAFSSNLKNYIYDRYFYDGTNAFESLPPINNIEDMKTLSNIFARSICNAHKSMRNTLYEQSDFERYIYDVIGSIAEKVMASNRPDFGRFNNDIRIYKRPEVKKTEPDEIKDVESIKEAVSAVEVVKPKKEVLTAVNEDMIEKEDPEEDSESILNTNVEMKFDNSSLTSKFKYLKKIEDIAASNNVAIDIMSDGNNGLLYVISYVNGKLAKKKSFTIDPGCILDRRVKLFPIVTCPSINGFHNMKFYEDTKCYDVMAHNRSDVDFKLFDDIFKGGVDNICARPLYGDKMMDLNRKVALITIPNIRRSQKNDVWDKLLKLSDNGTFDKIFNMFGVCRFRYKPSSFIKDGEESYKTFSIISGSPIHYGTNAEPCPYIEIVFPGMGDNSNPKIYADKGDGNGLVEVFSI